MDSLSFILLQFNHFTIWERDGLFKGEREREVKKFNENLSFILSVNLT